jgi:septal ring-binding cell division protein DamX
VQWGFDDAQIEAATKAAAPPPATPTRASATQTQTRRTPPQFTRPQPKKSRQAPVFALVFLLIIVGAAFGGWYWWKSQPVVAATPIATPKAKPAPPQPQPVVTAEVGGKETPIEKAPQPQPAPAPVPVPAPVAAPVPQPKPAPAPVQTSAAKFTLQIELVCQASSLAKAQQIGGSKVWSAPITYRNQACHRVFWGRYGTRDEADAAASQIPAELRASKPVVVTIPQ